MKEFIGTPDFTSTAVGAAGEKRNMLAEWLDLDAGCHAATGVFLQTSHCVFPVKQADLAKAMLLGASLERSALFPDGTCTMLLQFVDRTAIKAYCYKNGSFPVYRRESACAAACVAHRLGMIDHFCMVELDDVTVLVEITEKEEVFIHSEVFLQSA